MCAFKKLEEIWKTWKKLRKNKWDPWKMQEETDFK